MRGSSAPTTSQSLYLGSLSEPAARLWLKSQGLSSQRIEHSVATGHVAAELAEFFQLKPDQIKACRTAGLLHDCAKAMPLNRLLGFCRDNNIAITEADRKSPAVLHALAGPTLAALHWPELNDYPEVLSAIRNHTTGNTAMKLVEALVYIADKIEPTLRPNDFAQQVRNLLDPRRLDSLDDAILMILNHSLRLLLDQCQPIHPISLEARNHYLQRAQRCASFSPQLLATSSP
ncbi:MAG: bis(5'-nucleosyl)-tetraphosphatase (symmetrical) YqeK [Vampirovibrionales bacterium]